MGLRKLSAVASVAIAFSSVSSAGPSESENDVLIIVNKSVKDKSISIDRLRTIFLKQRTNWSSGKKIFPINAKDNSKLRAAFRKKIIGMSSAEEGAFWRDEKIRRGLLPPAEFKQTLRAVFEIRDGIGYVFRQDYKEGASKIIAVIPNK